MISLKIFCDGQTALYEKLKASAQSLGSAFQKVNFLRDLKNDTQELGRSYFPEITESEFNENSKKIIEKSIEDDFQQALIGIKQLPGRSKLAVALAYYYYLSLHKKIKRTPAKTILQKRIRISNFKKYLIIPKVYFMFITKMI